MTISIKLPKTEKAYNFMHEKYPNIFWTKYENLTLLEWDYIEIIYYDNNKNISNFYYHDENYLISQYIISVKAFHKAMQKGLLNVG